MVYGLISVAAGAVGMCGVMSLGISKEGGGIDNSQQLRLTCKVSPLYLPVFEKEAVWS